MKTLKERFWSKVRISDGCWLWTDKPHPPWNYGRLLVKGRERKAHRLSWELNRGPIPSGLQVLHHCDTPLCVRPDHLFLGTNADNMEDMARKGRGNSGHRGKTHCPQGHPYDEANTYRYVHNGKRIRQCMTCRLRRSRDAAVARKAKRHAEGRSRAEYLRRHMSKSA